MLPLIVQNKTNVKLHGLDYGNASQSDKRYFQVFWNVILSSWFFFQLNIFFQIQYKQTRFLFAHKYTYDIRTHETGKMFEQK